MDFEARLLSMADEPYAVFMRKLIPTLDPERVIGVRTGALRALAKEAARLPERDAFMASLPHRWFEEQQLHALFLNALPEYEAALGGTEEFLPFVDNWATCDILTPKVFRKNRGLLLTPIRKWLHAGHPYTIRFGLKMLMEHYLDEDFDPAYPAMAAALRSDEYYVNMMIAWYFATALAKQYEAVLPFIEGRALAPWTHNKTIQKAAESFRVPPEHKAALRQLRV